jgi:hypothetical protein
MPKVVQEKFQVTLPDSPEDHGWVTAEEARGKKGMPGREGRPGGDHESKHSMNNVFMNSLPPGMDIEDQEFSDIRRMGINTVGNMPTMYAEGDATNFEVNKDSLCYGFDKKPLLQTDDEYTREHNDAFYDDVGGFVERNNYLDRM